MLKVTLAPTGVVSAGAKWRRTGTTTWRSSGFVESGIPTGTVQVEFLPVSGWKAPAAINVTISDSQTNQLSRIYKDNRNGIAIKDWTLY